MFKSFWGSQEQQAQSRPQEISTDSWYPPSVANSPGNSRPGTPSGSSSGGFNVQRPGDRPHSLSPVPPAEAAGIISVLRDKSVDELRKLLSDKDAYQNLLLSLEPVKTENNIKNELQSATLQLARENLEKEPQIVELRNQCRIIRTTELAAAQEKLHELSKKKEETLTYYSPASLLFRLQGIENIQDWVEKIGVVSDLDSACNTDLTRLTPCSACLDAGMKVTTKLASFDPNNTKCFYFTCFYAAAIVNQYGPEDSRASGCILNIQMAKAQKSSNKFSGVKLISAILGVVLGILVSFWLFLVYRKWDKKRKDLEIHEKYVDGVKSKVLPNTGAKWFDVAELQVATSGFSQKNMLGQGLHGIVYKGVLSDGNVVAVKQIFDLGSIEDDEFTNESQIISKIRHRNLLALRGFCVTSDSIQGKRRYLVYDFMENGSLDDHLFNESGIQLSWPQRKNIILDVANGLAYLHHGIKPAIYHRDIKATNILLDTEMKAKVADFGLAKQSKEGQSHQTTRVAGTYGYLAPEYALYGQLTEKSDVYSFGIVILEVMSGRRALETSTSAAPLIADWAWALIKSGNTINIVDESIRTEGPGGVMERFVQVGILCAHVMVALRPSITDALKMLEGDIDIPPLPDRPLPLADESFRSSYNSFASPRISVTKLPEQRSR